MQTGTPWHLNPIGQEKSFEVTSFVAAYDFSYNPISKAYDENYHFSQIILLLSGEGCYMTESDSYPLRAGQMFYRPANHTSSYNLCGEHVHLCCISFVCTSLAMKTFEGAPISLGEEELATLYDLIKTGERMCEPIEEGAPTRGMRFKEDTPTAVLTFLISSLERFLSMVWCRLHGVRLLTDETQKVSAHLSGNQLVDQVKAYLVGHVEDNLQLGDICAHFCVSQTGLTRAFRKQTGQGVVDYFTDLKINEAKRRISANKGSFSDVAMSLGFSSSNYFSKVFKARVGMTPTEYSKFASKRRAAVLSET